MSVLAQIEPFESQENGQSSVVYFVRSGNLAS